MVPNLCQFHESQKLCKVQQSQTNEGKSDWVILEHGKENFDRAGTWTQDLMAYKHGPVAGVLNQRSRLRVPIQAKFSLPFKKKSLKVPSHFFLHLFEQAMDRVYQVV